MYPYQGGGNMINKVTMEKTIFNEFPYKFEAGTPNISGVIGLGKAVKYCQNIGMAKIQKYEHKLLQYATNELLKIPKIKIIGLNNNKSAIITFNIENIHANDLGILLDLYGICTRTGHLCAQPVLQRFNLQSAIRISFAIYNNEQEIDFLIKSIKKIITYFAR